MEKVKVRFEALDERFGGTDGDEWMERLFADGRWTEGPAYFPAGRYLVFSDIPNDRILRWDETTGAVGVFAQPAGYANGHTVDRQGRLVSCEHGNRRVTRVEHDGTTTVLADRVDGKRLNSPNDVVERADGSVWFTDPSYGIDSDYEGHRSPSEVDGCHVYRVDPAVGARDGRGRRLRASQRARVQRRRGDALHRGHPPGAHPPVHRRRRLAQGRRGLRHLRQRLVRRAAARRRPVGSGPRRTTGCTASHPTAPCSASSWCRRSSPT